MEVGRHSSRCVARRSLFPATGFHPVLVDVENVPAGFVRQIVFAGQRELAPQRVHNIAPVRANLGRGLPGRLAALQKNQARKYERQPQS